jgi:hypothetical protein
MATWIETKRQPGKPDFKNQAEITKAWNAGEDFIVTENGRYGSHIDNLDAAREGVTVNVRYGSGKNGGPGLKVFTVYTPKR